MEDLTMKSPQKSPQEDPITSIAQDELEARGFLELVEASAGDLNINIHPLLAASLFEAISVHDYVLMQPSLRLATHLLSESTLLPFWHGLLFGERHPVDQDAIDINDYMIIDRKWFSFDSKSSALAAADVQAVQGALLTLADHVRFRFTPDTDACPGYARTERVGESTPTSGVDSIIVLDWKYIQSLRDVAESSAGTARGALTPSCQLRLWFHLAKTIVHEICHAVRNWITPSQLTLHGTYAQPVDPFFHNQRFAELGMAWETVIFRGIIHPVKDDVSAPHGLVLETWPGEYDGNYPKRKEPRSYSNHYMVEMKWVQSLFTKALWERVRQGQVAELWPRKILGVRIYNETDDVCSERSGSTPETGLDADEDGVLRDFGALPPLVFDSPPLPQVEQASDADMMDVDVPNESSSTPPKSSVFTPHMPLDSDNTFSSLPEPDSPFHEARRRFRERDNQKRSDGSPSSRSTNRRDRYNGRDRSRSPRQDR